MSTLQFVIFAVAMLATAVVTVAALVMLPRVPGRAWRAAAAVLLALDVAAQVVLWRSVALALLSGWRP